MPLWGNTDADESKPKWLTTAQKKEVYANAEGWVVEAGSTMTGNDNTNADTSLPFPYLSTTIPMPTQASTFSTPFQSEILMLAHAVNL